MDKRFKIDLNIIKKLKEAKDDIKVGWIVKPEQEEVNEGTTDLTALVSSNPDALPDYLEVAKRLISYEIDMFTIDNPECL